MLKQLCLDEEDGASYVDQPVLPDREIFHLSVELGQTQAAKRPRRVLENVPKNWTL